MEKKRVTLIFTVLFLFLLFWRDAEILKLTGRFRSKS